VVLLVIASAFGATRRSARRTNSRIPPLAV